jgi:hypothetical protein
MAILFTIIGGLLGFVALIILETLSFMVFRRSLSDLIFGHSGLQALVFPMAGCILGFIWGNRIKDRQEQATINREIEQDRLRYENDKDTTEE